MKSSLFLGTALTALLVTGVASAAKTTYTGTLNGASEVPAVQTQATGTATLTFDDATKKLCGRITHTLGGDVNAAHLHAGAPGANGNPFVVFTDLASPMKVNLTLNDGQITSLVTGQFYVNLHTTAHAGGEIRGNMATGGDEQSCDADVPDAGPIDVDDDAGTSSGGTSSGGTSSGSANDAGTVRSDAGTTAAAPAEDDGCSTTGSAPGNGVAIAFGVGVALAAIGRSRRKR
ncbi:MAG: CHRD domain-containing protein [Labilithrix sp.]|nr:CHRD domain-containing protein [Labilithrix sp.]